MRSKRLALPLVCTTLVSTLATLPSIALAADAENAPPRETVAPESAHTQSGNASYYAHHLRGRKTASGQPYDPEALTAAHRDLPMGTRLQVTNLKNAKSVVVTVNDRGRLPRNRVVDVSSAAADALDMKQSGVTKVDTRVVGRTAITRTDAAPSGTETTTAAQR